MQIISFMPLMSMVVSPALSVFFSKINFMNSKLVNVSNGLRRTTKYVGVYEGWVESFNLIELMKQFAATLIQN